MTCTGPWDLGHAKKCDVLDIGELALSFGWFERFHGIQTSIAAFDQLKTPCNSFIGLQG